MGNLFVKIFRKVQEPFKVLEKHQNLINLISVSGLEILRNIGGNLQVEVTTVNYEKKVALAILFNGRTHIKNSLVFENILILNH